MALDFNVLAQTPSIAERFAQGRMAAQQEAEQNMLRQQRALQLQQQQEDPCTSSKSVSARLLRKQSLTRWPI